MKMVLCGVLLLVLAGAALAAEKSELDRRILKLAIALEKMQQKPDKRIPADLLRKAEGIILLDRTKAGLVFAYQGGSGVAMVKDKKSGNWGPVAFFSAHEASLGAQIGGHQSFIFLLLMNSEGMW